MQTRVLVAYSSNAGSTGEVARVIGEELGRDGAQIDVRSIHELGQSVDLASYTAVVIGGPMILGWHRQVARFVRQQRLALSKVPVAYFVTAMSLTDDNVAVSGPSAIYKDPRLVKPPHNPNKLSLKERYSCAANYMRVVLGAAPGARPLSVGFFGGRLDFGRLNLLQILFVMLVIGAQPGDYRNWDAIRDWAGSLRSQLIFP